LIRNEFAPASEFNLAFARNGAARQKFLLDGNDGNLTLPPNATRERGVPFAKARCRAK